MFQIRYVLPLMLTLLAANAYSQTNIVAGVVNDLNFDPASGAKVYTTGGAVAYTDSLGTFYMSVANLKDSVYVLFNNKTSKGYAIPPNRILSITLNMFLVENEFTEKESLPDVVVQNSNHYLDSLQNRSEYAKIFDAPTSGQYFLRYLSSPLLLGNLFSALKFKENKKRQVYKDFAVFLEEQKHIEQRYNKLLIRKWTQLEGAELEAFMAAYAPSFEQYQAMDDITLAQYVIDCYKDYLSKKGK